MKNFTPPCRFTCLVALLSFAGFSRISASNFHLAPIRIELSAQKANAILQIVNESDDPVTVQIHAVDWKANGSDEVFSDSSEILVNPPIATMPPKGSQLVRLAIRHPVPITAERAWRLIVEEVPQPPKAGVISMVLKISIPVFQKPEVGQAAPQLAWNVSNTNDGSLQLTASNSSNVHVQVKALTLTPLGTESQSIISSMAYVLPQGTHIWVIRSDRLRNASRIVLDAETDAGKLHEDLDVQSK